MNLCTGFHVGKNLGGGAGEAAYPAQFGGGVGEAAYPGQRGGGAAGEAAAGGGGAAGEVSPPPPPPVVVPAPRAFTKPPLRPFSVPPPRPFTVPPPPPRVAGPPPPRAAGAPLAWSTRRDISPAQIGRAGAAPDLGCCEGRSRGDFGRTGRAGAAAALGGEEWQRRRRIWREMGPIWRASWEGAREEGARPPRRKESAMKRRLLSVRVSWEFLRLGNGA